MMNKFIQRAAQFGPVGERLLTVLSEFPEAGAYSELGFVDALARLRGQSAHLRSKDPLLHVATSLLCLDFPLQIPLTRSDINAFLSRAVCIPYDYVMSFCDSRVSCEVSGIKRPTIRASRSFLRRLVEHRDYRNRCFPYKPHSAARTKENLKLAPLARSFAACVGEATAGAFLFSLCGNVTRDQAMSAVLYAYGLLPTYGRRSYDIAAFLVRHPDLASGLSTAFKALGVNSTRAGAVLCESQVLLGRAVGSVDLSREGGYRCDPAAVAEKVVEFGDELADHIRAVIRHELRDRDINLPSLDSWWSSRWLWCVNGSQNRQSSEALRVHTHVFDRYHKRHYRRMASEAVEHNPVPEWDGTTYISASEKLEAGKTRAIFACDTRSYFAFEWLLGSVQKAWRNDRVLLDPGNGGHLGVARRIRNFGGHGGVNLMIDFDDFNSHHSTASMQLLFDILCEEVGVPDWYSDVLHSSFDKMYLKTPSGYKHWAGTLPSGHRGTTFINSVLNAAYLRLAIGGPTYDAMLTLHTGDDVYLRVDTLEGCKRILDRTREIGCRINPAKQSVGFVSAEFLRMAITENYSIGYLPRSIASFSCGNWSSDVPLDPASLLRSALVSTRSLIARSGQNEYGRLVGPALRQSLPVGVRTTIDIIGGRASLDNGPVFSRTPRFKAYRVEGAPINKLPQDKRWPTHATTAYLSNHVAPIEVEAVERSGVDVGTLMIASSYSKGHTSVPTLATSTYRIRNLGYTSRGGVALASDLLKRNTECGVLNRYPLLNMVKGQLSDQDIRELLLAEGYQPGQDPRITAFGEDPSPTAFTDCLSYADAASLSKRTKCGLIIVQTPVYV